jgi:UDP-N-acetylmuramate dehydrogenase
MIKFGIKYIFFIGQFVVDDGIKLSAAWLIEYLGYKGLQEGAVGTYSKHALVIVNHGGATGKETLLFAQRIAAEVKKVFAVNLETEVRIIS